MREFVRKSNRRSINSGFSSPRIVFKLNASLCLLMYCVSDCLCCCRCGQSMRKCCIVYRTVLLHLWHVGGGRCSIMKMCVSLVCPILSLARTVSFGLVFWLLVLKCVICGLML